MAMQVRRVVTGHDENGKAIVVSDEQLTAVSRGVGISHLRDIKLADTPQRWESR
jgi:hypothetical protein